MAIYINPELVYVSLKRLGSREQVGKKHLERTSVLMYFLAFDATCNFFETKVLDFNPDSLDGKNCRRQFEVEFTKSILLERTQDNLKQVIELGKINVNGTSPEQRISSNFFSVPIKKSSGQKEPYYYPRRPSAPLLKMGFAATGKKWGIEYHDDWQLNMPVFLSDIKEATPFLDLALFICRDCSFDDKAIEIFSVIGGQLKKRFTKKMVDYWVGKIDKEKVMARHIENPFVSYYASLASVHKDDAAFPTGYEQMKKVDLIDHILYLEKILSANKIKY